MGVAFSPAADFIHINAAGGLSITDVRHKPYVIKKALRLEWLMLIL
jgi:hypothetical protein